MKYKQSRRGGLSKKCEGVVVLYGNILKRMRGEGAEDAGTKQDILHGLYRWVKTA